MKLHNFDFSKKIFYHPDRVATLKAGGRPFPVTVEIDLTNRCNHRCSFCFYAEHISTDTSTLKTEVVKGALTELKALGTRGVSFTGGGEPMIHKDFSEVLAHARATGLDCGLITNGSAIHAKNIDGLLRDLTWIRVSMAGGTAEHYRAVQGVDQFEKVIGNVMTLAEKKRAVGSKLNIGVRMLLTPANLASVVNLATRLAPAGIDYLQVAPDQFTDDGGAWWNSDAVQSQIRAAEQVLTAASTRLLTSGYVWFQDKLGIPQACHAHFFQIAILAEGHVAFCKNARGADKFYLGNINDKPIREIWDDTVNTDLEKWVTPANCGIYCKHIQMNLALEDVLRPSPDMSPNFVG